MSDSEVKKILKSIAQEYDCKIWLARKVGRRLAYINGMKAGKERFLPAKKLYESKEIVVLSEGLEKVDQKLLQTLDKVVEYFANKEADSKT